MPPKNTAKNFAIAAPGPVDFQSTGEGDQQRDETSAHRASGLHLIEAFPDDIDLRELSAWHTPLQQAMAQNPLAMAFKDTAGRYVALNDSAMDFLAVMGIKGPIIGRTDKELLDAPTALKVTGQDQQVMDTGEPLSFENIFERPPHRQIRLTTKFPVRNWTGEVIGVGLVSLDITARKEIEHDLKLSLERVKTYRDKLQAVFNCITEGIICFDSDLRVTDINPVMRRMCAVSRALEPGSPMDQGTPPCSGKCLDVARHVRDTGRTVTEFRIQCQDPGGRDLVLIANASPLLLPSEGAPGVLLTVRDVTSRDDDMMTIGRWEHRGMIGKSLQMQHLYSTLERLSGLDTTVLILGESGTGKELVVNAIHDAGPRSRKPLIKVNCSALSEHLLESELFGHVKGAYTGANQDKKGRFELADGGSIFLDEVGDISLSIQVKLLRFLESREYERVGDPTPRRVDVRVMAATNADLQAKVRRGEFRADLYYRLRVMVIDLPPLRERKEDIPLLLDHFINHFKPTNPEILEMSEEAIRCLRDYHWPGNVRQLRHAVESAFVVCNEPIIDIRHLPRDVRDDCTPTGYLPASPRDGSPVMDHTGTDDPEGRRILQALEAERWNKSRAAARLGIHRKTLYRKLRRHGIS